MTHAIEFGGVSRRFGGTEALRNVDLLVPTGSLFGLLGPNGAGKTTSINLLTTLLPPTGGKVTVLGYDATKEPDEIRKRIGFVPEEPLVYSGLTGREFVELSAILHGVPKEKIDGRVNELLVLFKLTDQMDGALATYSKGMRRKTLIAAALVCDPEVLVLDEPMEGLDVYAQGLLKDLLRQRVHDQKTVIYSTHIMEVADSLCSHLSILDKGSVVATGTIEEVKAKLGATTLEQAFENQLRPVC